jgi:hypothetical protein
MLVLATGVVVVIAMKIGPEGAAPVGARVAKTERPAVESPVETVADFSAALPPVIPAGHEGHGAECSACAAEKGLAACREDFARMEYARLSESLAADEAQSQLLLEGCRRFAAAVLKEWSHANSRPVLPADEIVAAQRDSLLGPVVRGIPSRTE